MDKKLNFGEEIREFLHPAYQDLTFSVAMPDPLLQGEIARKLKAVKDGDTAGAIKTGTEILTEILRGVTGNIPTKKDGQEPTLQEWATELFSNTYQFKRNDPVVVDIEDGVVKEPVSGLPLKEGEFRTWQDPRTLRMYVVQWDPGKDEPVSRPHRIAFGNHIIESVLFNASDDEPGKDSPTPSVG